MTATTTPSRTDRGVRTRPNLELVPDGYLSPRARRRRARLVAVTGVVVACGTLFGLAGVHVLLTEGQFRLQKLRQEADDSQAQFVRLRLQVAELESPERIVAAAQERLGMVTPSSLTYLTPTGAITVPSSTPSVPTTVPATRPVDTTQAWAAAKPALAARP